jgi:hypothetical protein
LAFATPKFYFAGSQKSRKSGFLRSIDRKNPQSFLFLCCNVHGFIPHLQFYNVAYNIHLVKGLFWKKGAWHRERALNNFNSPEFEGIKNEKRCLAPGAGRG